ncbi:MAG: hypothetical protein AAGA99_12360 [Actinomycetota bacterium]
MAGLIAAMALVLVAPLLAASDDDAEGRGEAASSTSSRRPTTSTASTATTTTITPPSTAATTTTSEAPTTTVLDPPEIEVVAAAWVVTTTDGEVVAGSGIDDDRPIASLAKLPLALATVDALTAADDHTVPASAVSVSGRRVGWPSATTVPTGDLLDGLLRYSGNDAAVTAAAAVGGDDAALAAIADLGGSGIRDVAGVRSDTVASPRTIAGWLASAIEVPALRAPLEARADEPLPGQGDELAVGDRVPAFVAVKTSWSPAAGQGLAALMAFGGEERLVVVLDAADPAQAAIDAYISSWWAERVDAG